ncbi:unnamed protein product [Rotaria socialis]|uniref:Uncharacterized protein n=1 Tax=Rotaria socialis TaxID=392032 RepID=A0A821F918_9BILA|nr:unnamed protein product [Rotaria socialis]CAF4548888.1 unnamed protein product [Rotaria socialis]CAF4647619.1 unnamed protein product [Rotaria socialis]CAF4891592.1 unnamed protein product [Rotaria socialis]
MLMQDIEGNEESALKRATVKETTLTAWFKLNCKTPEVRTYLYHDIPQYFVFDHNGIWKRRLRGENVIGRIFDDLKTVDGYVCLTFIDAAKRRGLLHDDTEYQKCMTEANIFQVPQQLRTLFCVILLYRNPTNPVDLWNLFKTHMAEGFMIYADVKTSEAMALRAIEGKLKGQGRSCNDFGISVPSSIPYSFQSKTINKEEEL